MKVALYTDTVAFAGTERHLLDLAYALRQNGVSAELACPPTGELAVLAREEHLPVFGLDSRSFKALSALVTMRAKLRSGEWDIIHAHNGRVALLAALACCWAKRGKLVTTQHFIDPARTKRRGWRASLAKWVHRWIERQTVCIVAISEAVKQALLVRDGTPPEKVFVVINGIRDPAENPLLPPEVVREQWHLSPSAPLIACICRLEPEKSVQTLVQAMLDVSTRFPEAVCVIGGVGSEQESIAGEIQRLGLAGSVRMLGFQKDPHSWMRAASVFVLPSRAEPFGLALVEAMAMRAPCLATRAGGPIEIIVEEVSGLLVPPDDSAAMSLAIQRLLADSTLRQRISEGARERFSERFTVARMGQEIAAVYNQALAAPLAR